MTNLSTTELIFFCGLLFLSSARIEGNTLEETGSITLHALHQARLLDDDAEAFNNLIQVLDRARKSIEIETFVFEPDQVGRRVLRELVKKADEGVRVRMLIDYYSNELEPGLDTSYGEVLASHGIELRYFNATSILAFWKVGFRNHSKLLVVDNREMIVGGRNIADEYFGKGRRINYLDRDVWLEGPMAERAVRIFDDFWNNPLVSFPEMTPRWDRELDARNFSTLRVTHQRYLNQIKKMVQPQPVKDEVTREGDSFLANSPIVKVHSVTFVSDLPYPGDKGRVVTPFLMKKIEHVSQNLLMENFLFICKGQEKKLFLSLLERKVRIELLTNGFFSEPNFAVAELANSRQVMAVHHGMHVFCYDLERPSSSKFVGNGLIWALHSKCMVIDGRDSVIGSYNLDRRSYCINNENTIIINDSPEFAALLESKIRSRMENGTEIQRDGSYADRRCCHSLERTMAIIFRPFLELISDFM